MQLAKLFPRDYIQTLPTSDWRHKMIIRSYTQKRELLGFIEQLLEFAEIQGILDKEMITRLTGRSYDDFRSAINEIAIAEFLLPVGSINWNPPGRDWHIGEFEIIPPLHDPIFVEVKTTFESIDVQMRKMNWQKLRDVAHQIHSPFVIFLEFMELPRDVVPNRFRAWLRRNVDILKGQITSLHQEQELIFEDHLGDELIIRIKLKFIKMRDEDLPTECSLFSGPERIETYESVKQVTDYALRQLPNTQPTLVVIADQTALGLDEFQMTAAMFSVPKVTFRRGTHIEEESSSVHYDLAGIVQHSIRTRISAVGVWHQQWTKKITRTLTIYHNPLAARPIAPELLRLEGITQLVPAGKGRMQWIPSTPD